MITPDAAPERVVELAGAALRGGADVIQLRHKSLARGELLVLARKIRDVTRQSSALFIVNDFVDIALLSEADGVHLGPDDLTIASAKRLAGEAKRLAGEAKSVAGDRLLIGASSSSPGSARAAIEEGADYLGSGPAFATPIKTEKKVIGPEGVAAIAAVAGAVPVFAIGGIDETNLPQLTALGLRRVCVIRAVADAADPESATRRLRAMLDD